MSYPWYWALVRLMITISPTASDWQSVTIKLAVRRDGLKTTKEGMPIKQGCNYYRNLQILEKKY